MVRFTIHKINTIMYTEQQKKEYQEMRRKRYADQQELREYLKGGFEMDKEQKKKLMHFGKTKSGSVFGGVKANRPVRNIKGFNPLI